MPLVDLVRALLFTTFGIGFGFMLATNFLAFQVLRPPRRLGFLWWHVTAISISFTCVSAVALDRVLGNVGLAAQWQTYVAGLGLTLFAVAQMIIFSVERQRYVMITSGVLSGDMLDTDLLGEPPP